MNCVTRQVNNIFIFLLVRTCIFDRTAARYWCFLFCFWHLLFSSYEFRLTVVDQLSLPALGVRGRAVQGPLWAAGLFLCLRCGFLEGGSMPSGGWAVGLLLVPSACPH